MAILDILFRENSDGYYDLEFENGDLSSTDGFTSALLISVFCERRATSSEVPAPEKRRGWWGNDFLGFTDFEMGSKLWLLSQARADQNSLNNSITYVNNAMQWFVDDEYTDKVLVNSEYDSNNVLKIYVKLLVGQDIVLNKGFALWENTIKELR